MAHKHSIYDTDPHFSINPSTRLIENESGKSNLTQYDHNSERFTFEMPKMVDGHDMSACNLVEIHYDNTDGKEISSDVYEVTDLQISPDSPNVVIFSWLISGTATRYSGELNFSISFQCTSEDGTLDYEWGTADHVGIRISPRIRNSEAVVQQYSDTLSKWKSDLFGIGDTEEASMRAVSEAEQNNIKSAGEAQIAAIEGKAAQALDSIPEDYTETSNMAKEAVRSKADGIVLTAEGKAITVNDSSNDYLRGLKLFGKSSQFTTTGKNLFNYTSASFPKTLAGVTFTYEDHWVVLNGTCTDSTNLKIGTVELAAGTYTISANNPTNNNLSLALVQVYNYDSAKALAATDNKNNSYSVGTLDTGTYECRIRIENGVTYTNFKVKPQLEVGSVATEHEPYTGGKPSPSPEWPQEIVSAENPTVTVYGKNLLRNKAANSTSNGITFTVNADGSVTVNGTATAGAWLNVSGSFTLPKGDYILSGCPAGGAYGSTYVLSANPAADYGKTKSFTLKEETNMVVNIGVYAGCTVNNLTFYPMIRLATVEDDTYEPYREPQTVTISSTLHGIPVTSGGNYTDSDGQQWICDEIDLERGVYVQRCNRNIFDGSDDEVWSYDAKKALFKLAYLNANSGWNVVENFGKSFMPHYNYDGSIWNTHDTEYAYCINFNSLFIRHKDLTSLESFKEYAANNPIELMCILPAPIEIPLSADEIAAFRELKTNYPNTTILNDSGAWMSVKYNADTKIYVDTPKILKMVDSSTGVIYELKIVDGNLTVVPV